MSFERARAIADTVLYEGYVLYPYRASAQKNRVRWQFGVLVPPAWSRAAPDEHTASQTECLVEADGEAVLEVRLRFLQVVSRTVEAGGRRVPSLEVDGSLLVPWEEGVQREVDARLAIGPAAAERVVGFELPGGSEAEPVGDVGRLVRERWPLSGRLVLAAEPVDGPYGLTKVRVRVENRTACEPPPTHRDQALRRSLVAAHLLLGVRGGAFVSLLDPPEWARAAASACANLHTFPVLAGEPGERDVMLSSPIILYDHPEIAPESPGGWCDATEIDELLALRTMTLTDAEKREARATDPQAASIIDRAEFLPPELLDRLHGAVRYLRNVTGDEAGPEQSPGEARPWWDPGADASVSPETDCVEVGGVAIAKGSMVRLRPGRRGDAQDMFLDGRLATVEGVFLDVDGNRYLAVTADDDPAAELQRWHGRFLYFSPEEVEPV